MRGLLTEMKNIRFAISALEESSIVVILDNNGFFIDANSNFFLTSKLKRNDIIGQPFYPPRSSGNTESVFHHICNEIKAGKVWRGETRHHAGDGGEYWLRSTVIPVGDSAEDPGRLVVVSTEITSSKAAELASSRQIQEMQYIRKALDESSIVAITDQRGIITSVNRKFCEISQYSPDELIGGTHRKVNSSFHSKTFFKEMWRTIRSGRIWRGEVKNRAKDGSDYWMHTTIVPFMNESGKPYQFISIRTDITQRVQAETALTDALRNDFRRTVQHMQNGVFKMVSTSDGELQFVFCEGKLARQLNLTTEQVYGKRPHDLFDIKTAEKLTAHCQRAFAGESINVEIGSGEAFYYFSLSPIIEGGRVVEVVGSMVDITERKKAEEQIRYLAHYDSLTNLPNRTLFYQELSEVLQKAKVDKERIGIMFVDLDRFKNINDTFGHSTGDALLQAVARRLASCLRPGDSVSRLGGDEFAIFMPGINRRGAANIAHEIIVKVSESVMLGHLEAYITPSIGICMYPDDGSDVESLLKSADAAMYLAKDKGKSNFQFYTKGLSYSVAYKVKLESDLRKALEQDQFTLYYQPQMNILTGQLVGMEALIRWQHPELGTISPVQFIPIAEETGLIVRIGEWVFQTACRQAMEWQRAGHSDLSMAVNISLRQFMQSNLVQMLTDILQSTGLSAKHLQLEISESMAMDANHTLRTLKGIKGLGVNVSMDDFGTGYSSLSYLSQFPIDKLKIDQSFLSNGSPRNKAIVKTIIDMANNLEIAVMAEGVESQSHVDFLKGLTCHEAQGYYFSEPLSTVEAEAFIQRYKKVM
jgi:diguanylate cyclase (GGDEF)-like protein/PAS domain S-box-containing protein